MKPLDRFHPTDDRLIAVYFGDEDATAEERRAVRQHLHGCEACTWRYTELTAPLERLRRDAASEAAEVFTNERLDAQRSAILDRLGEPAAGPRVIPFPTGTPAAPRAFIRRPFTRWVAAAAAAGLVVGVMAGRMLEFGGGGLMVADRPPVRAMARPALEIESSPVPEVSGPIEVVNDETFLSDLDQAISRSRIPALSVLDDVTPHVREVAVMARGR